MTIIKKEITRLHKLGYQVIETKGKRPIDFAWSRWSKLEQSDLSHISANPSGFGIVLGEASNLIAIDIDIDAPDLIRAVLELAPTSIGKIGRKGITLFYAYSDFIKSSSIPGMLDILASGRQTIMPPSLHPDTGVEYYTPKGFNKLPAKEFLPSISEIAYKKIIALFEGRIAKTKELQESNGRFKKIQSMLNAAAAKRSNPKETAKEVVEYDLKNHTPPWFLDNGPGDGRCKNKIEALKKAESMAMGCVRFAEKNNVFNEQELILMSQQKAIHTQAVGFKKLKPPTGELKKIFDLIKERTGQQDDNIVYMASMIVLSNIFSRNYLMQDGSPYQTTLNNFFVFIFNTGGGKSTLIDAMLEFAYCDKKNNLGLNIIPKSGTLQSLYSSLKDNSHNMCVFDEMSTILEAVTNYHTKSLGELITSCWDCAAKILIHPAYSLRARIEKEPETRENCSVTIVGATTQSKFEESANQSMMTSGFLNRFIIIAKNMNLVDDRSIRIDFEKSKHNIANYFKQLDIKNERKLIRVEDENFIEQVFENSNADQRSEDPMQSRRTSHIQKIALCLAISKDISNPKLTLDIFLEAKEIYETLKHNADFLLKEINHNNDFERDREKTISILKIYGPNLFESHLRQKVQPKSKFYDSVLKSLIESNVLIKTAGKRSGHRFSYNWHCELPE